MLLLCKNAKIERMNRKRTQTAPSELLKCRTVRAYTRGSRESVLEMNPYKICPSKGPKLVIERHRNLEPPSERVNSCFQPRRTLDTTVSSQTGVAVLLRIALRMGVGAGWMWTQVFHQVGLDHDLF